MATQEQVDSFQAALLAWEAEGKTLMQAIMDAATNESAVTPAHFEKMKAGAIVARAGLRLFLDAAFVAAQDAGVQPLSGGQDKD